MNFCHENVDLIENYTNSVDDDDDFRLNDISTHECHLHQNNMLTIYTNSKFLLFGRRKKSFFHGIFKSGIAAEAKKSGF